MIYVNGNNSDFLSVVLSDFVQFASSLRALGDFLRQVILQSKQIDCFAMSLLGQPTIRHRDDHNGEEGDSIESIDNEQDVSMCLNEDDEM